VRQRERERETERERERERGDQKGKDSHIERDSPILGHRYKQNETEREFCLIYMAWSISGLPDGIFTNKKIRFG
jgi:hypothetical protein